MEGNLYAGGRALGPCGSGVGWVFLGGGGVGGGVIGWVVIREIGRDGLAVELLLLASRISESSSWSTEHGNHARFQPRRPPNPSASPLGAFSRPPT